MAVRSALAPSGPGVSGSDRDAVIVADGVSKRYPVKPVSLFPPVMNFHRNWFKRGRSSSDSEAGSAEAQASPADAETTSPRGRASASTTRPRRREWDVEDDLEDDDDDDEDDDDLDDEAPPARPGGTTPSKPGEMFWALRDVSFRVPRGAALGVVGGPEAGKSTLLRILGGQSFPTEGRVLVSDRVSPPPQALAKALSLTGKGTFEPSLTMAARLVGIEAKLVKRYKEEIEELAQPLVDEDGEPAPGALIRLAVATTVLLPTSVILLDEAKGVDEAFTQRLVEPLRERLRRGSSLVLASRQPGLAQELCDEVISLGAGSIIDRGDAKGAARRYQAAQDGGETATAGSADARSSRALAPSRHLSRGQPPHVPPVIPGFNGSAALLSATLTTGEGRAKRIDATADEVVVEIYFETAVPDIEAHCGVGFTPRDGDRTGIRLEHPEPLRFVDPGTYKLVARPLPGGLRSGAYEVRVDAVVSNPTEDGPTVIARDIGRVRIVGDELDAAEPAEPPITHWDGRELWRAEAEWSIE